jgi:predicted TIM-barrel fold metal-dependent hydrolase
MPLPFKLVSADSHVVEPPDLWLKRLDRKYQDRAPRLVYGKKTDFYLTPEIAGEARQGVGLVATKGKYRGAQSREFTFYGHYSDVVEGGYDPHARLREMDAEGVEAELLYTSFGLQMFTIKDLDFQYAILRAFNDWLAEYCSAAPRRLFGIAMVPTDPIENGVAELERAARLGLRGAMISIQQEEGHGYDRPQWEPLWAAAQANRLPLSLHVAASKKSFLYTANALADFSLAFTPTMYAITSMIFSGVFDRHRGLKVASVENDAAWAAAMLERADDRFARDQGWAGSFSGITSGRKPSEIFREHVGCSFMHDRTAIFCRNIIGIRNLMWGSDYPHFDGAWPNSADVLAAQFDNVPLEDQKRIGRVNAIEFYELPIAP